MNYITLGFLILLYIYIIFYPIKKNTNVENFQSKKYNNNSLLSYSYDFMKYLILKN